MREMEVRMNMLNGIQNFLQLVNANWTTILVILGLCVGIVQKIQDYWAKSDEEKIEIAKAQIKETLFSPKRSIRKSSFSGWIMKLMALYRLLGASLTNS